MKSSSLALTVLLVGLGSFGFAQSKLSRFRFTSYDINPRNPKDVTVSINSADTGKTYFLSIGNKIPGTNWVIKGFNHNRPSTGDAPGTDRSEITIEDAVTKEAVNVTLATKLIELGPKK